MRIALDAFWRKLFRMNKSGASVMPLVGLSVVLSLSAVIAVAAHWQNPSTPMATAAVVHHTAAVQNVKVVMHDPGCHWFMAGGGSMKRTLHVSGGANVMNMDEAALRVAGPSGTKVEPVGSMLRLGHGTYRITMVGQASDDNHLKLVVN